MRVMKFTTLIANPANRKPTTNQKPIAHPGGERSPTTTCKVMRYVFHWAWHQNIELLTTQS